MSTGGALSIGVAATSALAVGSLVTSGALDAAAEGAGPGASPAQAARIMNELGKLERCLIG
jgi:hypothetical protein